MAKLPLTLFRGWNDPGRHVWSPFVVKLEARLRFSGLSGYSVAAGSPMTAPRGKIPYVECRGTLPSDPRWVIREEGGEKVASLGDSAAIIQSMTDSGTIADLNARLSSEGKAHDLALRALLEDKLYFYHVRTVKLTNCLGFDVADAL